MRLFGRSSTRLRDRTGSKCLGFHFQVDFGIAVGSFQQLTNILPINNDLLKLRSTTDSIPCVRISLPVIRLYELHDESCYVVRQNDGKPLAVPVWMTRPEAANAKME